MNLGLVMRTLFRHGKPRQAADAVLGALVAVLRLVFTKIVRLSDGFVGMLLPHPIARHCVAMLAA